MNISLQVSLRVSQIPSALHLRRLQFVKNSTDIPKINVDNEYIGKVEPDDINGKKVLIREAPEWRSSSKWGRTSVNDFYALRVGILPVCNTGDVARQKLAGFMRPESGTRNRVPVEIGMKSFLGFPTSFDISANHLKPAVKMGSEIPSVINYTSYRKSCSNKEFISAAMRADHTFRNENARVSKFSEIPCRRRKRKTKYYLFTLTIVPSLRSLLREKGRREVGRIKTFHDSFAHYRTAARGDPS